MVYIKLGPTADKFVSKKYNINLPNQNSAAQLPEELVKGVLYPFLLSGFFVQITKLEYDNIRLDNRTFGNLPISTRGVYEEPTIEPVLDLQEDSPVTTPSIGDRYVVFPKGTGEWSGHDFRIMEYTPLATWKPINPKNGWSVPVINKGISITYSGSYPSGRWSIEIPEEEETYELILPELPSEPTSINERWVLSEINKEAEIRAEVDKLINNDINALKTINQAILDSIGKINTGGSTIITEVSAVPLPPESNPTATMISLGENKIGIEFGIPSSNITISADPPSGVPIDGQQWIQYEP